MRWKRQGENPRLTHAPGRGKREKMKPCPPPLAQCLRPPRFPLTAPDPDSAQHWRSRALEWASHPMPFFALIGVLASTARRCRMQRTALEEGRDTRQPLVAAVMVLNLVDEEQSFTLLAGRLRIPLMPEGAESEQPNKRHSISCSGCQRLMASWKSAMPWPCDPRGGTPPPSPQINREHSRAAPCGVAEAEGGSLVRRERFGPG